MFQRQQDLTFRSIDFVGVVRHVNPYGSFYVVSQRTGEEKQDEMNERDRGE